MSFTEGVPFNMLGRQAKSQMEDLIGINDVSITLKIMPFVRYCLIVSIREYVKMLYIQSKFKKSDSNERNALLLMHQ